MKDRAALYLIKDAEERGTCTVKYGLKYFSNVHGT